MPNAPGRDRASLWHFLESGLKLIVISKQFQTEINNVQLWNGIVQKEQHRRVHARRNKVANNENTLRNSSRTVNATSVKPPFFWSPPAELGGVRALATARIALYASSRSGYKGLAIVPLLYGLCCHVRLLKCPRRHVPINRSV